MSDSDSEASDDTDSIFNDYVTLGKSSDFETVIFRFPDTDQCPLKNCMLSCSTRATCMAHFQMHHAEICMICTVCDELFLVLNPLHLLRHYQVQHPNERPPKLKETEDTPPNIVCDIVKNSEHNVSHKSDLKFKITMHGCGQVTSWVFPDITLCPNHLCRRTFKNRSETMKHFRDQHADHSIFCQICQKPIGTKEPKAFVRHYKRIHPNVKYPYSSGGSEPPPRPTQTRLPTKVEVLSNAEDDDDDDLITLFASGITTKWRHPNNLRECVVLNCHEKFKSKSDAMAHFRENHAIGSILCSICDRPIRSSKGPNDFRRHYTHKHPNHPIPFDFGPVGDARKNRINSNRNVQVKQERHNDDDLVQLKYGEWRFPDTSICPVRGCGIQFDCRLDAIVHYKQRHANSAALCQFCEKPIRVDVNSYAFIQHFRSMHPNQEIPYGFGNSVNQSTDQKFHAKWVDKSEEHHDENVPKEADDMIVLGACGLKFNWPFPPKLTRCPVKPCSAPFGTRSEAIDHYKRTHAFKSTLCPDCKKPVTMRKLSDIAYHYKQLHPNVELPPYFQKSSVKWNEHDEHANVKSQTKSCSENRSQPSNQANVSSMRDDDIITLSAWGIITQYQFPKQKQCPVANCRQNFKTRSDCIAHYKELHADGSILCPICVHPIRVPRPRNFQTHYQRMHSTETVPYKFETEKATTSEQKTSMTNASDANENDVITLTSGSRVTYWRFPKENWQQCPAFGCYLKFETRSDAIEHFKLKHTKNSMCCEICNKPIAVNYFSEFRRHFMRNHPDVKLPVEIGLGANGSQVSRSRLHQIKEEIDDENDEEEEDEEGLINLTTCGITTQWLFPIDCRQCPVGNCHQNFRSKLDGIKHYKKLHAVGSICCPVCDQPVRSAHTLNDFRNHFQKKHPHDKMPFKTGTKGFFPRKQQKHQALKPDEDDVIILSGLGQRMKWIFPKNLTWCPVARCTVRSENRAVLKAHYREIHANSAVLCEFCLKPIAARNGRYNLIEHYRSKHPNAAVPFGNTVESKCTTEIKPKMEIDSRVACDLCNVRIQPEKMDEHLNEMHRTHRIYCPLKLCSYVAKQMTEMRTHWKREHKGMEFPEFRDETDFSYVIDTSNIDDQKIVQTRPNLAQSTKNGSGEGSSKSTGKQLAVVIDSSDSESSVVEENPLLQVLHSNKRKKSSDSSAWFTGIETSNDNADDEPISKKHKEFSTYPKANAKRRRSNSSCSSSCSSGTYNSANYMIPSRKVARKCMYQPSDDNIYGSNLLKPRDAMKECAVILERLSSVQASNLNTATCSSYSTTSTESLYQSKSSTSTQSNQVFYVADSDEEEAAI